MPGLRISPARFPAGTNFWLVSLKSKSDSTVRTFQDRLTGLATGLSLTGSSCGQAAKAVFTNVSSIRPMATIGRNRCFTHRHSLATAENVTNVPETIYDRPATSTPKSFPGGHDFLAAGIEQARPILSTGAAVLGTICLICFRRMPRQTTCCRDRFALLLSFGGHPSFSELATRLWTLR